MAKTNRRPVDRLERLQRVEHRRAQQDDYQGLIESFKTGPLNRMNWIENTDDLEDDIAETLELYTG